jgi:hypothetical protein
MFDFDVRLAVCDELEQRGVASPGVSARLLPECYTTYENAPIEPASDAEVLAALTTVADVYPASLSLAESLGITILVAGKVRVIIPDQTGVQPPLF